MSIKDKFAELFEESEMQEYMNEKFDELSACNIAWAVYGSRENLQKKFEIFEELKTLYPEEEEYQKYTELLRWAMNHMKAQPGDVFTVTEIILAPKLCHVITEFHQVFSDFEEAVDYIKNESMNRFDTFADDKRQPEELQEELEDMLFCIGKWSKNSSGKFEWSICFDVMGTGKVIYFWGKERETWWDLIPNLPIPFKPGDIVTLDCRPYLPKRLAVVLEIGNNRNFNSRQCLYINSDDRINTGKLLKKDIFKDLNRFLNYSFVPSPLFRIERFQGEIEEKDKILKVVSDYINGDEKSGRELWEFVVRSQGSISKERLESKMLEKLLYSSTK